MVLGECFLLEGKADGDGAKAAAVRVQAQVDLLWEFVFLVDWMEFRNDLALQLSVNHDVGVFEVRLGDQALVNCWLLNRGRDVDSGVWHCNLLFCFDVKEFKF